MDGKFPIGAVLFATKTTTSSGKPWFMPFTVMGQARVEMLRKAYRREPLGENVVMLGDEGTGPYKEITWEDVAWETAGERVTGG